MAALPPRGEHNILPFPGKATERRDGSADAARPIELSPPGVRQTLEMARHALAFCSGRTVSDAARRRASGCGLSHAELELEFSAEIQVIDELLAELSD